MGEVTNQIAIVLGVLVACFAGPAAALFVLIRRKAKARQSRRCPIGIALRRGPGHSLRERLDEAHNDLTGDLVLLTVVPLLALALFLAQSHLRGLPQTAHLAPVCALAAIAFIACLLRKLLKAGTRLDHLKAGCDANVAVGQELDQPMTQLPQMDNQGAAGSGRAPDRLAGQVAVERGRVAVDGAARGGAARPVREAHRARPGSRLQRQGAGRPAEVARHPSADNPGRSAHRAPG